ncbi:uncharacterized protein LOC135135576 [Zophobas morio]|uniref:uncharacterized protein LOC135135576 n=1 Tax=Zophobas morio TaxID=2755281 RepID=UPI003083DA02
MLQITLAICDLPFREHRENINSPCKGNFLTIIDLLAKYDPVLKLHLSENNPNRFKYISPAIQNELVHIIISSKVKQNILQKIQNSPFFTTITDTTQDISKTDQLSQIIRYVMLEKDENNQITNLCINESFLGLREGTYQSAASWAENILASITEMGLNISRCRGQGYDGAAHMSGTYSGLQKPRICSLCCS